MTTTTESPIRGSCLCGAVAFEADRPVAWAHNCHCSRCRKIRGSAFASNAFVPLTAFRFTRGEECVREYRPEEAERFTHAFCGICGSSLPFRNGARGVAVIPMGSLDDDPGHPPDAHIFVASKAPWYAIHDELPRHPGQLGSSEDD